MSTIVFVGAPAYGHTNPTLPVVSELVRRGEKVIYYNTEEFRSPIEQSGAIFRPYPGTAISSSSISDAVQNGNLAAVSVLVLRATETLLPFLLGELPQQQPDVLVFDSLALWGRMAATMLKIRAAASISHFVLDIKGSGLGLRGVLGIARLYLPMVPRLLSARARLIRRFGGDAYPAAQPLFPMRGDLNIVYTSRELQPETPIVDATFRFVGPAIDPQIRAEPFPFEMLASGPIIYISLGTVHHSQMDFYQRCFEAFADFPAQFVLSAGRQTRTEELGRAPTNFHVFHTVPQLSVLQRASAFISHGGMNSVHESLYFGVPLVVIPQQVEQLLNARCVERQGSGLVIPNKVMGKPIRASELREALERILSEEHYSEAARNAQENFRKLGGYQQVADEIQSFLA